MVTETAMTEDTNSETPMVKIRKELASKFSIPYKAIKKPVKKEHIPREDLVSANVASIDEIKRRNEVAITLLSNVLSIVNTLKYYDKTVGLLREVLPYIHQTYLKEDIKTAARHLKAAKRASIWLRRSRKFAATNASSLEKNVDEFTNIITYVILEIQKDIAKQNGKFFEYAKKQIFTELPMVLPKGKTYTKVTAPVVIMIKQGKLDKKYPHERLHDALFLLKEATLLGVSSKGMTPSLRAKLEAKYGATLYEHALTKRDTVLDWYLLLDFKVSISSATFMERLQLPSDTSDTTASTLEDYAARVLEEQNRKKLLAAKLQYTARMTFEKDNAILLEDIAKLRRDLDACKEEAAYWASRFEGLTSSAIKPDGLDVKDYDKLSEYTNRVLLHDITTSVDSWNSLRASIRKQRIEARAAHIEYRTSMTEIKELRSVIKTKELLLDSLREQGLHNFVNSINL